MDCRKKLIVFGATIAFLAPANCNESNRIVGGSNADDGAYPYQVSLRIGDDHFCGGSVINTNWVLTAAHCVYRQSPERITVVVGTNSLKDGGQKYAVEQLIPHPLYNGITINNDIALIKLKETFKYDAKTQEIKLPKENIGEGKEVLLTGWGKTSHPGEIPEALQKIQLKSITNTDCVLKHPTGSILPSNICTLTMEGQGACHGDSGGPLVFGEYQIGVVSWGIPCAKGKPDVFTRVYSYIDWINSYVFK